MMASAVYSLISLCLGTGNSKVPTAKIVWFAPSHTCLKASLSAHLPSSTLDNK